jgi:uncharacterized protein
MIFHRTQVFIIFFAQIILTIAPIVQDCGILTYYIDPRKAVFRNPGQGIRSGNITNMNISVKKTVNVRLTNHERHKTMKSRYISFFSLTAAISAVVLLTACNQMQSSNPNVEIVQGMYSAFAAGDAAAVLAKFSPGIVWNEAESNSLAVGNPYIGPKAIAEGVFTRLGQEWETFTLTDQTFYGVGDNMVIVTGRYQGKHAVTGKTINAQKVHIWWFEDGMATGFQQYVDTKKLADAEME